jgi:hypothetical protein
LELGFVSFTGAPWTPSISWLVSNEHASIIFGVFGVGERSAAGFEQPVITDSTQETRKVKEWRITSSVRRSIRQVAELQVSCAHWHAASQSRAAVARSNRTLHFGNQWGKLQPSGASGSNTE